MVGIKEMHKYQKASYVHSFHLIGNHSNNMTCSVSLIFAIELCQHDKIPLFAIFRKIVGRGPEPP